TQDARALNGKYGTTTAILDKRPPRSTNTRHLRNGVRGIPLACRSNRSIPSSGSNSRTLRVRAGCASLGCCAAARRLPRLAIATTSRIWFSFIAITIPLGHGRFCHLLLSQFRSLAARRSGLKEKGTGYGTDDDATSAGAESRQFAG